LLRRASVRDCLDWIMAAARSQNRTCKKIVNLMLARAHLDTDLRKAMVFPAIVFFRC
jgi:hypothetical protein